MECPICGKKLLSHLISEGSRQHVVRYTSHGMVCSEPECEINHYDGFSCDPNDFRGKE